MIGDKWNPYIELVNREKAKSKKNVSEDLDIDYIEVEKGKDVEKSIEGHVLDKLGLHKYCCRRMILGNVHLISYI
tara:strand:- start:304 stop:528 length:225 start_codon:yes stop_codon:yes gene_type:complete